MPTKYMSQSQQLVSQTKETEMLSSCGINKDRKTLLPTPPCIKVLIKSN